MTPATTIQSGAIVHARTGPRTCPFCGNNQTSGFTIEPSEHRLTAEYVMYAYQVAHSCGARGPIAGSPREARRLWDAHTTNHGGEHGTS